MSRYRKQAHVCNVLQTRNVLQTVLHWNSVLVAQKRTFSGSSTFYHKFKCKNTAENRLRGGSTLARQKVNTGQLREYHVVSLGSVFTRTCPKSNDTLE